MKKILAGVALLSLLSGCVPVGDVQINTTTIVTTRESPAQQAFPRGEYVFACTTMADLYYYLDNNIIVEGCGQVAMTAVTERGSYDSYLYGRVSIYQFQHGWDMYFTYYEGWGWRRY
ncbi:hypothetical protein K2P47_00225 [Patescibacteria group bacterium]|nr:hypothetical protein [Patescibacteria group bacterium]